MPKHQFILLGALAACSGPTPTIQPPDASPGTAVSAHDTGTFGTRDTGTFGTSDTGTFAPDAGPQMLEGIDKGLDYIDFSTRDSDECLADVLTTFPPADAAEWLIRAWMDGSHPTNVLMRTPSKLWARDAAHTQTAAVFFKRIVALMDGTKDGVITAVAVVRNLKAMAQVDRALAVRTLRELLHSEPIHTPVTIFADGLADLGELTKLDTDYLKKLGLTSRPNVSKSAQPSAYVVQPDGGIQTSIQPMEPSRPVVQMGAPTCGQ